MPDGHMVHLGIRPEGMHMQTKKRAPIIDRDDYLIRLIIIAVAMFAGTATGKIVLDTALAWWGPK